MAAAGARHSILLRSDGAAVAFGNDTECQCRLPLLQGGVRYTSVAAGAFHTVLLRCDGKAVAIGGNAAGQCQIPELPAGLSYTAVAAGYTHTTLLRSDGVALSIGRILCSRRSMRFAGSSQPCRIPELRQGVTYTGVAAGGHNLFLRSDGAVNADGTNDEGQCDVPDLPDGIVYTGIAAGDGHTVLLCSDGTVRAFGRDACGQCQVPALPNAELLYIAVFAGDDHTVLLRNDGQAVAFGQNDDGECSVPLLPHSEHYTFAAAGGHHTVLLRSDGEAIALGRRSDGQCHMPEVQPELWYEVGPPRKRIIQLHARWQQAGCFSLVCLSLGGNELLSFDLCRPHQTVGSLRDELASQLLASVSSIELVLPNTFILCKSCDMQTLADIFHNLSNSA